jgi:hemolysin III
MDKGSNGMLWSLGVFGFGMLMAYLASTLYHMVEDSNVKSKMRVWDHIGIFLLIGGTYTPVVCRYTDPRTAIVFLTVMWSLIAIGSVLKVFHTGKYDRLSTFIYLFLGWMVVFIIKPVRENMPFEIFMWILAGGMAYTLGVIFYKWRSLKYQHSIWHLFVLAGTALQFVAVYKSL